MHPSNSQGCGGKPGALHHFAPDEHPYIHELESRLSSLSLFITTETRRKLLPYFDREMTTDIYPNPTPVSFADQPRCARPERIRHRPERVLVVSNHADPELMAAKALLTEQGLQVRHVGVTGEGQELITPELIDGADVVIAIGKTVQYCLVSGRPVYVYDRFGGYGYLDDEQLPYATKRNFSGRGGRELSAQEITREVLGGYDAAVHFHSAHREEFIDRYSIDRVVPRVLAAAEPRSIAPFETSYHHMLRSAQSFGARFFHYWGHNANEVRNRTALSRDLQRAREEIAELRDGLGSSRGEVGSLRAQIDQIHQSWTFRAGRMIVRPLAAIARTVRALRPRR